MNDIPFVPKKKRNEWAKKPIIIGILAGLNAALWGILINFWIN